MGSPIVPSRRIRRHVLGVCLLLGLCTHGFAQIEESPLLEYVDQKMIDIGSQIANARKRLSMSDGIVQENPNGESGMGLTCCTDNLRTIAEKLQAIRVAVERMAIYYRGQQNGKAMGILGDLDARILSIATGAAVFGRAPNKQHASAAIQGFIRPWNEFRNGVQALRICCPIPLPVDPEVEAVPDEDEGGKKKSVSDSGDGEGSGN